MLVWSLATPGVALASAPVYAVSWEINLPDAADMTTLGNTDGGYTGRNCPDIAIITLDFGQVTRDPSNGSYDGYGIIRFDNLQYMNDDAVLNLAEDYVSSWVSGLRGTGSPCSPNVHLALGVNDYAIEDQGVCSGSEQCDPKYAGMEWAYMVGDLQQYLLNNQWSRQTYGSYFTADGAGDWEDDFKAQCDSNNYTPTVDFLEGFNPKARAVSNFYDFGDAAYKGGCWSESDYAYVARWVGTPYIDRPQPEIYNPSTATEWTDMYKNHNVQPIAGVMTDCSDGDPNTATWCSTPSNWYAPDGGYNALQGSVNQSPAIYALTNFEQQ